MDAIPFKLEVISKMGPPLLLIGGVNTRLRHWQPYLEAFKDTYRVICLTLQDDLPYPMQPISVQELKLRLRNILSYYNNQPISIITFSMGSRVAFTLLTDTGMHLDKVLIIAPDGVVKQPLFEFATRTWVGKWLFDKTMMHLGALCFLSMVLNKMGLVDTILVNLLHKLRMDKASARLLYNYWIIYGNLQADWKAINQLAKNQNIHISFLFGKADIFIPSRYAEVAKIWCPNATVEVLPVGHYIKDIVFLNYAKKYLKCY